MVLHPIHWFLRVDPDSGAAEIVEKTVETPKKPRESDVKQTSFL